MSQSQLHKAKKSLDKLERLYTKTLRRLDNLKRNAAEQQKFLVIARTKYDELNNKNLLEKGNVEVSS